LAKKVTKKGPQRNQLKRFLSHRPTPLKPESFKFALPLDPHRTHTDPVCMI